MLSSRELPLAPRSRPRRALLCQLLASGHARAPSTPARHVRPLNALKFPPACLSHASHASPSTQASRDAHAARPSRQSRPSCYLVQDTAELAHSLKLLPPACVRGMHRVAHTLVPRARLATHQTLSRTPRPPCLCPVPTPARLRSSSQRVPSVLSSLRTLLHRSHQLLHAALMNSRPAWRTRARNP
ncbi:hypothetical protein K466DRAFT_14051 [Polyporus arcularius HHB13444]|uniref:Uncharacterized protein n=1 Tax=Polyporus arcularius HHB13444 TaxID=1314778 RepID=A0A5C3NSH4_9APHY|nr:hypothetical protein K466DRAFT_14051 [Polyporus arcularius HHB13444]